jgi:hypothetical protein
VFFWLSAKKTFAECFFTLGKAASFAECFFIWHSAKKLFAECLKRKHPTNHVALGKEPNSGSDQGNSLNWKAL